MKKCQKTEYILSAKVINALTYDRNFEGFFAFLFLSEIYVLLFFFCLFLYIFTFMITKQFGLLVALNSSFHKWLREEGEGMALNEKDKFKLHVSELFSVTFYCLFNLKRSIHWYRKRRITKGQIFKKKERERKYAKKTQMLYVN